MNNPYLNYQNYFISLGTLLKFSLPKGAEENSRLWLAGEWVSTQSDTWFMAVGKAETINIFMCFNPIAPSVHNTRH